MVRRFQPCLVDNKLSKSTVYFQSFIQSLFRLCTVVIITIIRWYLIYGMSIVTKITFIYNNRLTLGLNAQCAFLTIAIDKLLLNQELPTTIISHP